MTIDELAWLKSACAAICQRDARGGILVRGSGYLIAPDRLGTCQHVVVEDDGTATPCLFAWLPGEGEIPATVEALDAVNDAAVLRLARPVAARPLERRPYPAANGDVWTAYGFPELLNSDVAHPAGDGSPGPWSPVGKTLIGKVTDAHARDVTGVASLDLSSSAIAAGQGARPHGFSGSPVMAGRKLIGHLKRILENDDQRAEMGVLYACPANAVARLAGLGSGDAKPWAPRMEDAPYSRDWYVHHPDNEALALTRLEGPGTPVVLCGPSRSGKTQLLRFLVDEIGRRDSEAGTTSLFIELDLKEIVPPSRRMEDLVTALVTEVAAAAGAESGALDVLKLPRLPLKKLEELFARHILPGPQDRCFLVLEHADEVWARLPAAESAQFYAWLRGLSQKAQNARWGKFRLLMALSTTPALLIRGEGAGSPWPPSDTIQLDGLDLEKAAAMAELYRLPWSEAVVARLLDYVGPYPWFARRIMYYAANPRSKLQPLDRTGTLDTRAILDHFKELLFDDLKEIDKDSSLKQALMAILTSDAPYIPADAQMRLQQAGIVDEIAGKVRIHSKLCEDFIRDQWKLPPRN